MPAVTRARWTWERQAMLLHPGEPQINLIWMLLGQMGPFPLRCVTLLHAAGPLPLLLPPDPLFPWVFWASLSWSAWASPLRGERQALRPLPAAWQGAGSAQQWVWLLGALGGEEGARTSPRPQGGAQQPGSLWRSYRALSCGLTNCFCSFFSCMCCPLPLRLLDYSLLGKSSVSLPSRAAGLGRGGSRDTQGCFV